MKKKYIIELEDKPFHKEDGDFLYRVKGFNSLVFDMTGIGKLTPYNSPDLERVKADAYLKGLNDGQGVILESTQNNAFNNGYKKCLEDMEHDKGKENSIGYKIGYKKGYVDGLNRISDYEDKIRKEAYEKGFKDAAYNCEETCTLVAKARTEGYNEGQKAGERHGMKLAWEAARKICGSVTDGGLNHSTLNAIFGSRYSMSIMHRFTASEAIERLKALEQEQDAEIKVGDEVINRDKKAVVTEITDRFVRIMYSDGSGYALFSENMTKTGRNFPEIATVLKKMRGEQDG